jgi:hypothetical protein
MSIAIDTNVLVRILVQDPTAPEQCAAARRLVTDANAARSGGSAWTTRQCPIWQLGQQSIPIAATRHLKAPASSMARGLVAGTASVSRWVLIRAQTHRETLATPS